MSPRQYVWTGVGALAAAVTVVGATQRTSAPTRHAGPRPIYGLVVPADSPLGPAGVCQELEYVARRGWRCDSVALETHDVTAAPATAYPGACGHLRVDGTAWVCLAPNVSPPDPPVGIET